MVTNLLKALYLVATPHRLTPHRVATIPVVARRHTRANRTSRKPRNRNPTLPADTKVTHRNPVPIRNRDTHPSKAMEDPLPVIIISSRDGGNGNSHHRNKVRAMLARNIMILKHSYRL